MSITLVTGPPSSGKTRWIQEKLEGLSQEIEQVYPHVWADTPDKQHRLLQALFCLGNPMTFPKWFYTYVLDAQVSRFCRESQWAAKFPANTPSATKMKILRSRMMEALAHMEASLAELETATLSPFPVDDLEAERVEVRSALQTMATAMDQFDSQGRHDDAAVIFAQKAKLQSKLRMLTGAIEAKRQVQPRGDRRAVVKASIAELGKDLAETQSLLERLSGLRKRFDTEIVGYVYDFTGLKVEIGPAGQIEFKDRRTWIGINNTSSTEYRGCQIAVALATQNATNYPTVLIEEEHVPKAALALVTERMEV